MYKPDGADGDVQVNSPPCDLGVIIRWGLYLCNKVFVSPLLKLPRVNSSFVPRLVTPSSSWFQVRAEMLL